MNDPVVALVWVALSPYHADRTRALSERLSGSWRVVAIGVSGTHADYGWKQAALGCEESEIRTLFPNTDWKETRFGSRLRRLRRCLKDLDAEVVFLCNYDLPEIFLTALWLRARGRSPVLMSDSKFDDKPRRLHRELRKWAALLPYRSALVGGHRAESYLRYLGFRRRPIAHGYDTVSTSRIRANAGAPPAPEGARFDERHWLVIARLVPKKNLFMLLDAYAMYCTKTGERRRRLTICGSGPLENDLRREASRRGLDRVVFTGWLQEPHVDEHLAQALALLLPSYEEQWGLAVNEATAMGLPVFCTPQVGAGDALVRAHVNGFLLESDNAVGWANAMVLLDGDEARWRTFCNESRRRSAIGDVTAFGDGVRQLLDLVP